MTVASEAAPARSPHPRGTVRIAAEGLKRYGSVNTQLVRHNDIRNGIKRFAQPHTQMQEPLEPTERENFIVWGKKDKLAK